MIRLIFLLITFTFLSSYAQIDTSIQLHANILESQIISDIDSIEGYKLETVWEDDTIVRVERLPYLQPNWLIVDLPGNRFELEVLSDSFEVTDLSHVRLYIVSKNINFDQDSNTMTIDELVRNGNAELIDNVYPTNNNDTLFIGRNPISYEMDISEGYYIAIAFMMKNRNCCNLKVCKASDLVTPLYCSESYTLNRYLTESTPICNIKTFEGKCLIPLGNGLDPGNGSILGCGPLLHTYSWLSFKGGAANLSLHLNVVNCKLGYGMQIALYEIPNQERIEKLRGKNIPLSDLYRSRMIKTVDCYTGKGRGEFVYSIDSLSTNNYAFLFDGNNDDYCDIIIDSISISGGIPTCNQDSFSYVPLFYDSSNQVIPDIPAIFEYKIDSIQYFSEDRVEFLPKRNFKVIPKLNSPLFKVHTESRNLNLQYISDHLDSNTNYLFDTFYIETVLDTADLSVVVIPLNRPRVGSTVSYNVIVENRGSMLLDGQVILKIPSRVTNVSYSNFPYNLVEDSIIVYNLDSLIPFKTVKIRLDLKLNSPLDSPSLNIGDTLCFLAEVMPIQNDYNAIDNRFELKQSVLNSYDPNDKTCLDGNFILEESLGEYLTYMIRFENTGNDRAIDVYIRDQIDTNLLDISTLRVIESSHPYQIYIYNEELLEFRFNEINLSHNEGFNEGHVVFQLRTKIELNKLDTIKNKAAIFFDQNPPIITNEVRTHIKSESLSNTIEHSEDISFVHLFPNPTTDRVTIVSNQVFEFIDVFDMQGQLKFSKKLSTLMQSETISINHLPNGVYFLKISSKYNSSIAKLIVN